jgi:hypothetical protein
MKYEVRFDGVCPLINKHHSVVQLEANSEEEARQAALDLYEAGQVEWKAGEVVGASEEIQLESVTVTPSTVN